MTGGGKEEEAPAWQQRNDLCDPAEETQHEGQSDCRRRVRGSRSRRRRRRGHVGGVEEEGALRGYRVIVLVFLITFCFCNLCLLQVLCRRDVWPVFNKKKVKMEIRVAEECSSIATKQQPQKSSTFSFHDLSARPSTNGTRTHFTVPTPTFFLPQIRIIFF